MIRQEKDEGAPTESVPVLLARVAVESWVTAGALPQVHDGQAGSVQIPEWLKGAPRGVFVCIKDSGELRGCVGTIAPARASLCEEIIENAVSAATGDPRFAVVAGDELSRLSYSVDILGDPEDISGPEDLDPKNYGVIVSAGGRRGLLLPDIQGVSEPLVQLQIACQKAGILPGESYRMMRFKVDRYN